jgi:glycosyltransferase involved in cell wall biosynthesis
MIWGTHDQLEIEASCMNPRPYQAVRKDNPREGQTTAEPFRTHSILRDTIFSENPLGHGGDRRTLQIAELVRIAGLEIEEVCADEQHFSVTRKCFAGGRFILRRNLWPAWRHIGYLGHTILALQHQLARTDAKAFLWEANREQHLIYPVIAKQHNLQIVAVPHNIESLVGDRHVFSPLLTSTRVTRREHLERRFLKVADRIFCISRNDQLLLNTWGLNADYLPYYPPRAIEARLLDVRHSRTHSEKDVFTIIGTAGNLPTRVGLLEQIHMLSEMRATPPLHIEVVGRETEFLMSAVGQCHDIRIHGYLEESLFKDLLVRTKAVLIHRAISSGATCTIAEMLIAGIPVIANQAAARDYEDCGGLHVYGSANELFRLIQEALPTPSIPRRRTANEQQFTEHLGALYGPGTTTD